MGRTSAVALVFSLIALVAGAEDLPQYAKDIHLGVKTCSGAPCHGNARPVGKVVLQNEHTTWARQDAHANAYAVLTNARSQRIARNLGLREPAHEADLCLDCHADNVPASKRGEQFTLEDGVTCEACHGGSERWLGQHISGKGNHADNVALGLYPTDDPEARANLCLSCHFGDDEKFVTHRIMGAGHPRMSFELDTFTEVQPAHFVVDEDYVERGKATPSHVQVWAIGQAEGVRSILDGLQDSKRSRDGVFPEFVFLDCHACHHPMQNRRWRPRSSTGLGNRPGIPRLNDSSFLMLRHALVAMDPDAAATLRSETRALHQAMSGQGDIRKVAKRLDKRVKDWAERLATWKPDAESVRRIAQSVVDEGIGGEYLDYAAAEQAAMALQALTVTLANMQALGPAQVAQLDDEIEKLLGATQSDQRYQPSELPAILRRMKATLSGPARVSAR